MTEPNSIVNFMLPGPNLGTEGDPVVVDDDTVDSNFVVIVHSGHSPATPGTEWLSIPAEVGRRRIVENSSRHVLNIRGVNSVKDPVEIPPGGLAMIVGNSDADYELATSPITIREAIGIASATQSGLMSAAQFNALQRASPSGTTGLNQRQVDGRIENLVSGWALARANQPTEDGEILKQDEGSVSFGLLQRADLPDQIIEGRHIALGTIGLERLAQAIQNAMIPAGGDTNQVLAKRTANNYDVHWADAGSGGGGLTQAQVNNLIDNSRADDWREYTDIQRGSDYLLNQGNTAGELFDTGIDLDGGDVSIKIEVGTTASDSVQVSAIPDSTAGTNALLTNVGVELAINSQDYRLAKNGNRILFASETLAETAIVKVLASGYRLERSADRNYPDEAYEASRLISAISGDGNVSATASSGKVRLQASGLSSDKITSLSAIPAIAGYSVGEIVDVNGVLWELVDDEEDANVYRGVIADLAGDYIGDSVFSWDGENIRANLPKTPLTQTPPNILYFWFDTPAGVHSLSSVTRNAAGDAATTYSYLKTAGDNDLIVSLNKATKIGSPFSVEFYKTISDEGTELSNPQAIQAADRWERLDRNNVTLVEVGEKIKEDVLPFARDSSIQVPASQLHNAPGGRNAAANKIASLAAIPAIAGYSVGELVNVSGILWELVANTDEPNVYRTTIQQLAGGYIGDANFNWDDGVNIRAYLLKSVLGQTPPNQLDIRVRTPAGLYSESSVSRAQADDSTTRYAYHKTLGDPGLVIDKDTAVGEQVSIEFYRSSADGGTVLSDPQPVHAADRWEREDRNDITLSELKDEIADPAEKGNTDPWDKDKLPPDTVFTDTQRFTAADAVKLDQIQDHALAQAAVDGRVRAILAALTSASPNTDDSLLIVDASDSNAVRIASFTDLKPYLSKTDLEVNTLADARIVAGVQEYARDSTVQIPEDQLRNAPTDQTRVENLIGQFTGQADSTDQMHGEVLGSGYTQAAGTKHLVNSTGTDPQWVDIPSLSAAEYTESAFRNVVRTAQDNTLYIVVADPAG